MVFVMMKLILENAFMMVEIAVDTMSTQYIAQSVNAKVLLKIFSHLDYFWTLKR